MKKVGSQGIAEAQVAYQMGLQCPIGQEIEMLVGLEQWWPDLPYSDVKEQLLKGLADRFNQPAKCPVCGELSETIVDGACEQCRRAHGVDDA